MNNIIFFLSGINKKILERYKIFNWKYLSKFFNHRLKDILWSFTYFLIFNVKNKKSIKHFLMEDELVAFFLFNNSLYNINFLKNLYLSLKIKVNKKYIYINIIYRKMFIINIVKTLYILKKKNNISSIKKEYIN
jgi:hypothetical protein